MTQKNIRIIVGLAVIAVIIVGVWFMYKKGIILNKYALNGSVSECTLNGKRVYQFVANSQYSRPQHYSEEGNYIPCIFNGPAPSDACKQILSSLKACNIIYRTNKDWRALPSVYTDKAPEAVKAIKSSLK